MYEFDRIEIERCDLDLKTGSLSLKNVILIFKTWRQSYFETDDGLDTMGKATSQDEDCRLSNNNSAGNLDCPRFLAVNFR
jgi:hypothetical protein